MKLNSESDRLKHPLAKKISPFLWYTVFKFEITEKQMTSMQTGISTLLAQPSTELLEAHKENPEAAWCCIILGNPKASDDDLIQVASRLGLNSGTHLKLAAAEGRLSLVEKILNQVSPDELKTSSYAAFRWAGKGGHLEALEYLEQKMPMLVEGVIKADNYDLFRGAAESGYLAVLKYLEQKTPMYIEDMIKANNYYAFLKAAKNGHLVVLEYLIHKAPTLVEEMIKASSYAAFLSAAENGHLAVLKYLEQKAPALVEHMIKVKEPYGQNYGAFCCAAKNGHLQILEHLEQIAPTLLEKMITTKDDWGSYVAFLMAAQNGQVAVLQYLEQKASSFVKDMIKGRNYYAFSQAAYYGHLAVLEYLEQKAPSFVKDMIKAGNYDAFCKSATHGHLEILKHLEQKAPSLVEEMIKARNYDAFRRGAREGHLAVLEYLEQKAPTLVANMIETGFYYPYRGAAQEGYLAVLEHLEQKAPALVEAMIKAEDCLAFRSAARNGDLAILEHLEQKAPALVEEMIEANNCDAFRGAAANGRLAILEHLEQKAPGLVEDMIKVGKYGAFLDAARRGHLAVLEYLEQKAPALVEDMIKAANYCAFREAAREGFLTVLKHLEQKAPTLVEDMIKAENYAAFRMAAQKRYLDIINDLLPYFNCFAYAEMHEREYRSYVYPFVARKLTELKARHVQLTTQNPNAVFDLADSNEIKLCFYLLRNIIRRRDQILEDDMYFLLQIPAVKALVHVAVTPHEPNELIRLALTTGNWEAAAILLTIPAVRTLAEEHDFYRRESSGELDLRALARNRESSIKALSIGEQQRLQNLTRVYQPMIQKAGVEHLITGLREQLKKRYQAHSAMIDIEENGSRRKICLPFTWEAFQTLTFTSQTRQRALKAYYQNKNHSAWRYLLKPNPWMHPNASYVYTDDTRTQRWSSFEEYQLLIALLWLSATDASRPPADNHTLEGRLDHFVDELSLIGRAHNWDQTRRNDQGQQEEYDDLEGDKPSCCSGVKRRLFQSLLGHPLFTILTIDIIDQELRDFVRTHFKEKLDELSEQEKIELRDIYQEAIILMEEKDFIFLRAFDISSQKQQQFIAALKEKYGAALNENPGFEHRITSLLTFQEKEYPHLVIWGERVGIATIFPAEKTANISMTL